MLIDQQTGRFIKNKYIRECHGCGSNETKLARGKYENWYMNYDMKTDKVIHVLCTTCYNHFFKYQSSAYHKQWYENNKARKCAESRVNYLLTRRIGEAEFHAKIRRELFDLLGRKCMLCGYDKDIRALQFDHINGGGTKQREELGNSRHVLRYYHKHLELVRKELQVLCANCNRIKVYTNKEWIGKPSYWD